VNAQQPVCIVCLICVLAVCIVCLPFSMVQGAGVNGRGGYGFVAGQGGLRDPRGRRAAAHTAPREPPRACRMYTGAYTAKARTKGCGDLEAPMRRNTVRLSCDGKNKMSHSRCPLVGSSARWVEVQHLVMLWLVAARCCLEQRYRAAL
jgi:hypothetical protein